MSVGVTVAVGTTVGSTVTVGSGVISGISSGSLVTVRTDPLNMNSFARILPANAISFALIVTLPLGAYIVPLSIA